MFRENHKHDMKRLKDDLESSLPKELKKDEYRRLKEEKDIQHAERVRIYHKLFVVFGVLMTRVFSNFYIHAVNCRIPAKLRLSGYPVARTK